MNLGSIGEIPPSAFGSFGLISATLAEASFTICANCFHSGSISKSQWDLLFGSFQNITASTMIFLCLLSCSFRDRPDKPRPIPDIPDRLCRCTLHLRDGPQF